MSSYKPPISTYVWPGQTHFGFGTADLAGQEAKALGARHVFVVGDPGIIAAGLLQPVEALLKATGLTYMIYDEVKPNPDIASVEAAVVAFRESGAELVIGVGGGSGLDTAKAVRLRHILGYARTRSSCPTRSSFSYSSSRRKMVIPTL